MGEDSLTILLHIDTNLTEDWSERGGSLRPIYFFPHIQKHENKINFYPAFPSDPPNLKSEKRLLFHKTVIAHVRLTSQH